MQKNNNDHLKIIVFTNGTASPYWRFNGIADRLNTQTEHEMVIVPYTAWKDDVVGKVGANLVILEQLSNPVAVDRIHEQGAKAVFEADDAMLDSYKRERKNLQHIEGGFRGSAIETIRKVDALTVTNKLLAENYARFTKAPIYVLPNYLDTRWYGKESLHIERNSDEIRLVWFGSKGHYEDLRMVMPAIKKVLEKYPNVKLVYCGYGGFSSDKLVTEIGWGEDVFKEIPRSRREFYIAVKPDYWPYKHKTLDADIEIVPLISDYFNSCKTGIKFIEGGLLGIPMVCSPTVYASNPWNDPARAPICKHGKTGFIADTLEDWEKYLSMLIENKQLRKQIGEAARHDILKRWDLDTHWTEWLEVYETILNS